MEIEKEKPKSPNESQIHEDSYTIESEETTPNSSIKPKRVIDSKIKKTILLILIVICAFIALFPNAGLGAILGSVASDLNDTKNISWYMTVFSLSSTISQLLGVRISDCLGRRRTLLTSTCLAFVITLICAFSVNSEMFIACRLLQGFAVGTNLALISAVLVDLFDMKERLKYQSLLNTAFGLSFIIGPILGSVLVDHLSWRYMFWFTAIFLVPVNIGFYYLIDIPLRPEQTLSKENMKTLMDRIDPIGCFLITAGMSLFLLGMYLGSASNIYTWSSPIVIGFFTGFGFLLIGFLAFEKFITPHPLFPSPIILDIHLILCYFQQFGVGWQFIFSDILIFIQYQAVYNLSPTETSMRLLPSAIVHIIATIASGKLSYRFENPKAVTIIGNIFNIIGASLFIYVQKVDSYASIQVIITVIYAIGTGLTTVSSPLCYQMIMDKKDPQLVATSISLARCFHQCGTTISTAFVLSLIQSQTTNSLKMLQNNQLDTYRDIIASNAAYDYVKIKNITSSLVRSTLNSMYFENIRNITYAFLAWGIICLFAALIAKIPSISKNVSNEKLENK